MFKNLKRRLTAIVSAGLAVPVLAIVPMASATGSSNQTVVVRGNTSAGENQPGWLFNRDVSTSTPYQFNDAQASIGDGSLYVLPIGANASDKFIAENFINTKVSKVNSISYDYRIGSGGEEADKVHFYMSVYANFGESDDLKFYDCRYSVVPTVGSTSGFTTVTFDPTQAYPVTTRTGAEASPHTCPAIPADMDALSPGSNIRVFALNVGDTSTNDQGLDGYLDKVVVDVDKNSGNKVTTYDFEPPFQPTGEIKKPKEGQLVSGWQELKAFYNDSDKENDDAVNWAVRAGTCAANTGTVFGNVDGHNDPYDWNGKVFKANLKAWQYDAGQYCFVFNPTDDAGQNDVRETRVFYIGPSERDDCRNNGWQAFGDNFASERECLRYLQKHHKYGYFNGWHKWWKYWWWS